MTPLRVVASAAVDIAAMVVATWALSRGWLTPAGYVPIVLAIVAGWSQIRRGKLPPSGLVLFLVAGLLSAKLRA